MLHSTKKCIYLCGMNFNIENSKQQLRKGVLELCVLAIIADGEIYPSEILEKLRSVKLIVVEGTMYPMLTRLKDSGLLTYQWVESNAGPPRKYYSITKQGQKFLNELNTTWLELMYTVNKTTKNLK